MVEVCHNMACRRHGAAEDYLCLHAQTHHLMKYYVCHKYGVSPDYNTFNSHPWHGAGQGAVDATLRYIALSDTLIDAYHEKIQPWCLRDLTMTITIIKSIKAFIDDVAMSVGGPQLTFHDLTLRAKQQLQWWNQLIQATGGALNSQKCCCTIYNWQLDKYEILHLSTKPDDSSNILLDPTQPQSRIEILAPDEGTRYLGIYISPNGSTTTMETHLWKKAVLYTKALQCTHMSCREAGVLYHSCFLPAIVYPFPATWIPEHFLNRIMHLSTPTILNKMGLHHNLPRSMVFAPRTIGGMGLCNLTHEHAAQQIIILI